MYRTQPEEYYNDIAAIACKILEIPISELNAIYNKPCKKEQVKNKLTYTIAGKVRYYTNYINKNSEKIKFAKYFVFYYLWNNKIKSPISEEIYRSSYINAIVEKINSEEEIKNKYEIFAANADSVKKHNIIKETIEYFA